MMYFFTELIKPLFDYLSTPLYAARFYSHLSSFSSFKRFIKYNEVLDGKLDRTICINDGYDDLIQADGKCRFADSKCNKCYCPCCYKTIDFVELYSTVDDKKLYEIYQKVKGYKFHDRPTYYITRGNTPRYYKSYGGNRYKLNCHSVFREVYSIMMQPILKEEKRKEEERVQELKKQEELLEKQIREAAFTMVKINKVTLLNSFTINIEFEIEQTQEKFEDNITKSSYPLWEYKCGRFLCATGTGNLNNIFGKDFPEFKSKVENQIIYTDIKRENNRITIDNFLDSIFYRDKNRRNYYD